MILAQNLPKKVYAIIWPSVACILKSIGDPEILITFYRLNIINDLHKLLLIQEAVWPGV